MSITSHPVPSHPLSQPFLKKCGVYSPIRSFFRLFIHSHSLITCPPKPLHSTPTTPHPSSSLISRLTSSIFSSTIPHPSSLIPRPPMLTLSVYFFIKQTNRQTDIITYIIHIRPSHTPSIPSPPHQTLHIIPTHHHHHHHHQLNPQPNPTHEHQHHHHTTYQIRK